MTIYDWHIYMIIYDIYHDVMKLILTRCDFDKSTSPKNHSLRFLCFRLRPQRLDTKKSWKMSKTCWRISCCSVFPRMSFGFFWKNCHGKKSNISDMPNHAMLGQVLHCPRWASSTVAFAAVGASMVPFCWRFHPRCTDSVNHSAPRISTVEHGGLRIASALVKFCTNASVGPSRSFPRCNTSELFGELSKLGLCLGVMFSGPKSGG